MKEKLFKKNLIHKGRAVDFYCDEIVLPNNHHSFREYLGHPGAAAVLPFLDKKTIVLVKQYRYPVKQATLELPAGKLEKGESPVKGVKRELKEETGYSAKKIEKLIQFYPSTAFSNELLHIFAATDLVCGKTNPDEDEFVANEILDFDEAVKMVYNGKIMDAKTIIALLLWANKNKK
ncbi:MAG: NUDIX hydrolase [Elusimicrobiota bacterium]|jgi:ADP-ribose pyrophosphatase|nr:NUDIX hydrolase [Elusimicrobiota bacterium]